MMDKQRQCEATASADSTDDTRTGKHKQDNVNCAAQSNSSNERSDVALSMFITGNPSVALPVAKAILLSSDGQREMMVRVLLDTASNRSDIRRDVSDLLGIAGTDEEELVVSTFGGVQSKLQTSQASFRIRKLDSFDTVQLEYNIVDEICQLGNRQRISTSSGSRLSRSIRHERCQDANIHSCRIGFLLRYRWFNCRTRRIRTGCCIIEIGFFAVWPHQD
jgi:hypothetical protein